ncbi:hypothetical protein FRC08_012699 [Ceratobasidium sp. 394]|nr:hypothetical protein FRC08_012699 [Ceratobasidium sp. 394]
MSMCNHAIHARSRAIIPRIHPHGVFAAWVYALAMVMTRRHDHYISMVCVKYTAKNDMNQLSFYLTLLYLFFFWLVPNRLGRFLIQTSGSICLLGVGFEPVLK